eukprot:Lankesteria_metandrocarpae@DN648_c0_g1_i1.p1
MSNVSPQSGQQHQTLSSRGLPGYVMTSSTGPASTVQASTIQSRSVISTVSTKSTKESMLQTKSSGATIPGRVDISRHKHTDQAPSTKVLSVTAPSTSVEQHLSQGRTIHSHATTSLAQTDAPQNITQSPLWRRESFVDGQWIAAEDNQYTVVKNPATGALLSTVPKMNADQIRVAILAAKIAQTKWKALLAKERCAVLKKWHSLIIEHRETLAQIVTAEMGKVLSEAREEIDYGAAFVEWFAEEAKRAYGLTIPENARGRKLIVMQEPVGVVACITPWNFPIAMITRKVSPALAVGCTVIVKPSTKTPMSALALAYLAAEAGFPRGTFNVVTGDSNVIGHEFTKSKDINKISFTGSTAIGKQLLAQCAPSVKKLALELGGNAPMIVFEDADIEAACTSIIESKFRNSGQTCIASNRVFVHDLIYGKLAESLTKKVQALRVGAGTGSGVQVGPLIDTSAVERCSRLVVDALSKGAEVKCGGTRANKAYCKQAYLPTVITEVTDDMAICNEEIFGPLCPLLRFHSEKEVVDRANSTEYGLAGYFCTKDYSRAWRVAESLECGIVGINTGLVSTEVAPFGGVKESGMGREGSKYGLDDYLNKKYVCMAGI